MSQTIPLIESRETLVALSLEQARAINALGRRLASKTVWWGDVDEGAQPKRSVIDCRPRVRARGALRSGMLSEPSVWMT
jgi:hypothetical protein